MAPSGWSPSLGHTELLMVATAIDLDLSWRSMRTLHIRLTCSVQDEAKELQDALHTLSPVVLLNNTTESKQNQYEHDEHNKDELELAKKQASPILLSHGVILGNLLLVVRLPF